jgi:hypothetical protein
VERTRLILSPFSRFFSAPKIKGEKHDPANHNNKQLPHPHLPKMRQTPQTPLKKQAPKPMQNLRHTRSKQKKVASTWLEYGTQTT